MQIASSRVVGALSFVSLVALLVATAPREAEACGGCVAPPGNFSAVDSHRMVVKLGLEESILWDQFIYSGVPEEFAWILPVPSPETVVEIADGDFIDIIDRETAPIVAPPACATANAGGCDSGCSSFTPPNLAEEVTVHRHEMVGPYETVVIGAEDPNAIYAWLGQNNYAFPDDGLPVLDYYTERESSFVVLRLRPGEEVSAMQPVRVRFKGYMGQFPLRMISLGVAGAVDLSLWIVADDRYGPMNFESRRIDPTSVAWNWESNSSNYQLAFEQTIADAGGSAWITEYAQPLENSPVAGALFADAPADLAMAKAGIHYPVLTRMRTTLPVSALSEDLILGLSDDPSMVPREIVAEQNLGECGQPVAAGILPNPADGPTQALFLLLLVAPALVMRRRRGRHQSA